MRRHPDIPRMRVWMWIYQKMEMNMEHHSGEFIGTMLSHAHHERCNVRVSASTHSFRSFQSIECEMGINEANPYRNITQSKHSSNIHLNMLGKYDTHSGCEYEQDRERREKKNVIRIENGRRGQMGIIANISFQFNQPKMCIYITRKRMWTSTSFTSSVRMSTNKKKLRMMTFLFILLCDADGKM